MKCTVILALSFSDVPLNPETQFTQLTLLAYSTQGNLEFSPIPLSH